MQNHRYRRRRRRRQRTGDRSNYAEQSKDARTTPSHRRRRRQILHYVELYAPMPAANTEHRRTVANPG